MFFPLPVATAEVRVLHRFAPVCTLYSIQNSCRVTPGFLISVSKYNMCQRQAVPDIDVSISLNTAMETVVKRVNSRSN